MNDLEMYIKSFQMKYEAFLTGCDALEELGEWDVENLGEMEAFYANDMVSIIIRLIAIDGQITDSEVEYLNHTFGFDYTEGELAEVYENCQEDLANAFDENFENGISLMRKVNGKLADAYKELLALICRIVIESDRKISPAELAEVKRLQALCEE